MNHSDIKLRREQQSGRSPAHVRSKHQEEGIAKRLGGRATLASGALSEKGDVRVRRAVRVEAKTTTKKSFSVNLDMLRKIENAALTSDEFPAMEIEFLRKDGKPIGAVAVVPVYVLEMMGSWKESER